MAITRTREVYTAIENLARLAKLFRERREQLASKAGLTEAQWELLEEIATEQFMPSMFARDRDSSPAAVSKVLRQLLDRDLVRVTVSAKDGRQRDYALTSGGKSTLSRLRAEREKAIAAIWMPINLAELQRFSEFAADLIRRIETFVDREKE